MSIMVLVTNLSGSVNDADQNDGDEEQGVALNINEGDKYAIAEAYQLVYSTIMPEMSLALLHILH